jgi:hypothetical protein
LHARRPALAPYLTGEDSGSEYYTDEGDEGEEGEEELRLALEKGLVAVPPLENGIDAVAAVVADAVVSHADETLPVDIPTAIIAASAVVATAKATTVATKETVASEEKGQEAEVVALPWEATSEAPAIATQETVDAVTLGQEEEEIVDPFADASFPADFPSEFPEDASAFPADFSSEYTMVFPSVEAAVDDVDVASTAFPDADPDPFSADPFPVAEDTSPAGDAAFPAEVEFPSATADVPFPGDVGEDAFDPGFDAAPFANGAAWPEMPMEGEGGDQKKKKIKKDREKKKEKRESSSEKKGSVVLSRAQRAKLAKKAGKNQAKETGSSFVDALVAGSEPAKQDM